jgi:hypothetical protein
MDSIRTGLSIRIKFGFAFLAALRHICEMNRTDSNKFVLPRYSYAQVETALAAVFDIDAESRGPLKGRLKHLVRLGLPGLKARKGSRIAYSGEHVAKMLIALLLEEAGIDPAVAVNLIQSAWEQFIWPGACKAMDGEDAENKKGNHVFLTIKPHLMTGLWTKERHPLDTSPTLAVFRRKTAKGSPNMETFVDWAVEKREWRCFRDLTADCEVLMNSLDGEKP